MPRPRRIVQRRQEFVEDLDGVKGIVDDVTTFTAVGGTWATHLWKTHATFEMLAVRAYTSVGEFLARRSHPYVGHRHHGACGRDGTLGGAAFGLLRDAPRDELARRSSSKLELGRPGARSAESRSVR